MVKQHIGFWITYTFYFYLINWMGNPSLSFVTVLLSIPIFALIFYSLSYILDNYFARKLYLKALCWILLIYSIIAFILIAVNQDHFGLSLVYGHYLVKNKAFNPILFLQSYLILIGHFTFLAILGFQYRTRLKTLEEKNLEMELRLDEKRLRQEYEYASLAQQVSPHMLVNVFQSWAYQIRSTQPTMAEQIDQMYLLMRYFMESNSSDTPRTILLDDEINMVKKYLQIESSISAKPLFISWNITGKLNGIMLPPTTLLTLIMNVFKHGDVYNQDNPVEIIIESNMDCVKIQVQNPVPKRRPKFTSHGVGLNNLSRRLEMVFGKQFEFVYGLISDAFLVEIVIYKT